MKLANRLKEIRLQNNLTQEELANAIQVTRQTIIAMLRDMGLTVEERYIMPEELPTFSECWLTGTAAEVTPVGQIGEHHFQVGALTRQVSDAYEALVRR